MSELASELADRLARLSPARRAALARLAGVRSDGRPGTRLPPALTTDLLTDLQDGRSRPTAYKAAVQQFYDVVNGQLDLAEIARYARFLNYGYLPDGIHDRSVHPLPAHALGRNSIRLALEVVADRSLAGLVVLDVGCGRGGTVAALGTHCAPATVVGLDLSSAAVAFCRRVNTDPAAHFVCGDAEHLPFPDGTFGAVVNIESSHSYPDLAAFYRQVYRILQPGGSFLYADTVPADSVDVRRDMARTTGFSICDERDITANVLRSCDEQAGVHAQAFVADNDRAVLGDFLAVPGSQNYLNLQSGRVRYLIWRWDRP